MNEWMAARSKDLTTRAGASRPISGSTVNREMNLWSAAFAYGIKSLQWTKVNPCLGASRPPNAPARNRSLLTRDEIRALCIAGDYVASEPLQSMTARVLACWLLSLETGMRSGELLRLRPRDYDRENMTVKVAALEVGGRKGTKSGRIVASRHVPLTQRAADLLDQLLAAMPADQLPKAGFLAPPFIVGMDDASRDALWRKVRSQSGVEDLTFHDAKHEACTRLSKIIDVLALSHAIGTKDIRLLRDTYYINDAAGVAKMLPSKLAEMA
jgi:integrase